MAQGYLGIQGVCHPTVQLANDAYYGTIAVEIYPCGTNQICQINHYPLSSSPSGWIRQVSIWPATGGDMISASYTVLGQPNWVLCDPAEGFTDGMIVGWGIAAALIAAAAFKLMRRAM